LPRGKVKILWAGSVGCWATIVTDEMFLIAARELSSLVTPTDLESGVWSTA
jgi:hypothetical protein